MKTIAWILVAVAAVLGILSLFTVLPAILWFLFKAASLLVLTIVAYAVLAFLGWRPFQSLIPTITLVVIFALLFSLFF